MSIEDIMANLKSEYINGFPEKLERIQEALKVNDKDEVKTLFHQIKGSGETYGFAKLSSISATAESGIKDGLNWQKVANEHLTLLQNEYNAIKDQAA